MSPGEPLTGDEAIARGKRLIGAIETQMMATDPGREPFALVVLQAERAEALDLLEQTERRALAVRRPEPWPGTHLHARWPQIKVGASFGG